MEPVHTPQPPITPVTVPSSGPAPQLPHLIVEDQKRSKAGIFGVVVLALLLLGLPVGIFLVSQRTQLAPQAAVTQQAPEVAAGIFLESKLSLDSQNGVIPVDIFVKSPVDPINLVNAQISFDPGLINVEKISTDSAALNIQPVFSKWIESSFDNAKGTISIIAGLPTPGAKTGSPNDEQIYLGTLYLGTKTSGTAILQVKQDSQVLRNSDNANVFKSGNDLVLNLSNPTQLPLPSLAVGRNTPAPKSEDDKPVVVVTSPVLAKNYSYFGPLVVSWSSFNVDIISAINLYVNGELLGPVVENVEAATGSFNWQPNDTLALHYIQPANTFEIEIIGVSKDGESAKVLSGPFGILGTDQITGGPPNLETFGQNQLTVADASRALSNYLVTPLKEVSLDLNKDGVINELDVFLIRQNLLIRGVIK